MSKWSPRQLATAAIIAALYTVMSLMSSVFGLTYGPIQCRFSEALTVLPFFLPEAIPGLFVGCLVTNLMSTVGPLDIIFGSMATLLAALWTARMPNKLLATLPPVICNAVIIGAMIAWYEGGFSAQFPALFAYNAVTALTYSSAVAGVAAMAVSTFVFSSPVTAALSSSLASARAAS